MINLHEHTTTITAQNHREGKLDNYTITSRLPENEHMQAVAQLTDGFKLRTIEHTTKLSTTAICHLVVIAGSLLIAATAIARLLGVDAPISPITLLTWTLIAASGHLQLAILGTKPVLKPQP